MNVETPTVKQTASIPPIAMGETMTGADMLLRCLLLEGVEYVFGYPGGTVLPIYDSLYGSHLKHILTRHEQGAIHAADGYARTTGKPGVVIATSGPGATNLVTGIATAQMDSVPLVCITGNVAQNLIGTDAFQEANIIGITIPITKHNYFVRDINDLPRIIKEAFHIATTGRPGPVLVDIPKDVNNAKAPFYYPEKVKLRTYNPTVKPNNMQIERMVKAIAASKKPVILSGGGTVTAGAEKDLLAFAEKTQIPVIPTLMGLASFPGTHPLCPGMPGMHGSYAANQALLNTDLIVAIGAQVANPDQLVISISGDGGFQMNQQELAVAAGHKLPVKIAIINNHCLGMVRQWQELFYDNRYSQIDLASSVDFVKLADAYGIKGLRASTEEEAEKAWKEALETDGPVLVEFVVEPEENVYPMVAAGSTLDQMVLGVDTKAEMRKVLKEIQEGTFAKNWILENQSGRAAFGARRRIEKAHPIEQVGKQLREMMAWIKK
ncbi:thiamine pyrophosphate-binding protein [Aneurinibacillus terranovensis]|uniref:thiamine pyrophosphate-binding protein n=1 Tax=Aneurinibacillus terranovensis TaxID=278991 RepID=UPI000408ECA6|nr:thiamine pyrophosphate-binding protein [Aneurinibacillus terranovensis]